MVQFLEARTTDTGLSGKLRGSNAGRTLFQKDGGWECLTKALCKAYDFSVRRQDNTEMQAETHASWSPGSYRGFVPSGKSKTGRMLLRLNTGEMGCRT